MNKDVLNVLSESKYTVVFRHVNSNNFQIVIHNAIFVLKYKLL